MIIIHLQALIPSLNANGDWYADNESPTHIVEISGVFKIVRDVQNIIN